MINSLREILINNEDVLNKLNNSEMFNEYKPIDIPKLELLTSKLNMKTLFKKIKY